MRDRRTGRLNPAKLCEPTNGEEVGEEMGYEDFYEMKEQVGKNDPCNVRRRRMMNEEEEEQYDDMDEENDGYDFDKEFEYGDLLGFTLWTRDKAATSAAQ